MIPSPSPDRRALITGAAALTLAPHGALAAGEAPAAIARFVPERFDDLMWENDRVAHRIYGPALQAREPPSGSGVDIWAKRTRAPFMQRQLATGSYHLDHGEGLDFYDVGRSRGAGGLGVWYDNKLWTSRNFVRHRILQSGGPLAAFEVDYAPWPVDVVRKVWETRAFALPLGSNFTRMTATLWSDTPDPIPVALGVRKFKNAQGSGVLTQDAAKARLCFWEPEDPDHGALGIAVLADPALFRGFAQDAENQLMLLSVPPGRPFTWYVGVGWNRGLDFRSMTEWDAHVALQRPEFGVASK